MPSSYLAGKIKESPQSVLNQSFDTDFNILSVEVVGYDAAGNVIRRVNVDPSGSFTTPALTTSIDYVSGTNPIYIGIASPGTLVSAASWQIKKITYDTNNNPTNIQYGGGTAQFNQVWNNRASLSYS